ncbi:MAG: hypothetical protein LJE69_15815, partial [Thiohalocapsa sp.]|uniref:hypothetical protein n=1 Tax=Thiohalocapsa sp. TaxID=2497641 RepID=UPI0025FAB25F
MRKRSPPEQGELDWDAQDSQLREDAVWARPAPEDFRGRVMQGYQTFISRDEAEQRNLSNTLAFWDALPKYGIPRNQQAAMRNEHGDLPDYERVFEYSGREYRLLVRAARVKVDGHLGIDIYPSEREQLVESALRYQACQQAQGFYTEQTNASTPMAGVVCTIYQIRKLLAARKRHLTPAEIREAIEVLYHCRIGVCATDRRKRVVANMPIIGEYHKLDKDGDADDCESA